MAQMSAGTTIPVSATQTLQATWNTYVALRDDDQNRHVRMTFDDGRLELMSPNKSHERVGHLIGRFIDVWTYELGIDIQSCGTTTFRRQDLKRGLEPDKCYYIAHEAVVREREECDLSIDPPPDLAIEVDVTSGSLDRMAIYAALGVPEVWRWSAEIITVYLLGDDGTYREVRGSRALPGFPLERIAALLGRRSASSETVLVREFVTWIRDRGQRGAVDDRSGDE